MVKLIPIATKMASGIIIVLNVTSVDGRANSGGNLESVYFEPVINITGAILHRIIDARSSRICNPIFHLLSLRNLDQNGKATFKKKWNKCRNQVIAVHVKQKCVTKPACNKPTGIHINIDNQVIYYVRMYICIVNTFINT